jgi:4-amino-4-deoxy-L-arabinose transferase-like glycosyltransferase
VAALIAMIALAAFVGRAIYILTVTRHQALTTDEFYYEAGANSIAAGHWFKYSVLIGAPAVENAEHPPLTSVVLAPVALVSGDSVLAMRFAVAVAGVGVVVLIALLAWWIAGARAALLAALIAAVYANLWANDGLVLSETFSALGTAATLLLTYRLIRSPNVFNAVGAGLACAWAMLARSELALFVPLLVLPAVLTVKALKLRRRVALAGIVVVASACMVAPWVGYNLARFENPVLLSYPGGGLLGANCPSTYSGSLIGFWNGFCTIREGKGDPSVLDKRKAHAAYRYMRDHLTRLPVVGAARVGRLWSAYRPLQLIDYNAANGEPRWVSWTGWIQYFVLLALAIPGAVALRQHRSLWPLLIVAAIVTLTAAGFYGRPRFRVPAEVSITVLAAVGIDVVMTATAQRRAQRVPVPLRRRDLPISK